MRLSGAFHNAANRAPQPQSEQESRRYVAELQPNSWYRDQGQAKPISQIYCYTDGRTIDPDELINVKKRWAA